MSAAVGWLAATADWGTRASERRRVREPGRRAAYEASRKWRPGPSGPRPVTSDVAAREVNDELVARRVQHAPSSLRAGPVVE